MLKKASVMFVVFVLLLTSGLLTSEILVKKYQRSKEVNNILGEITKFNDPQSQFTYSAAPFAGNSAYETEVKLSDSRVANLKSFFRKYNSVLYNSADLIVQVSDRYQFDYRLLPAIAMQESNLCRVIPDDSHNCWGWGIYGDTVTKFDSYDEAIQTVAKGIKRDYIDKGLVTASSIMQKYTPSSNGSWAHGVNTFLRALE